MPYFRVFCTPLEPRANLINTDDQAIQQLVRQPRRTREAGWVLYDAHEVVPSPEGLQANRIGGRKLFLLKNGHLEYWEPCLSELFQWSQAEKAREKHPWLYPYAICELPVNFFQLASDIYERAGLECEVLAGEAFYSIQGFILVPYRPRSVAFIQGYRTDIKPYATQDLKVGPVTVPIPFTPDHVAYELTKQVYQAFGLAPQDIYLFDKDGNFCPEG